MIPYSDEWFIARKTRIGSSDAAYILDISSFGTRFNWAQRKLEEKSAPFTKAMKHGHDTEDEARSALIAELGIELKPEVIVPNDWQIASLDGFNPDHGIIAEIKCPMNEDVFTQAALGHVKAEYYAQIQHQLGCVPEAKKAVYWVYWKPSKKGVLVDVYRDEPYIENLFKKEREMWEMIFIQCKLPEMSDKDYTQREDDKWTALANKRAEVYQLMKKYEELVDECNKALVEEAAGKPSKGSGVTVFQQKGRSTVDYKAIPELIGKDLTPYTKQGKPTWIVRSS